MKKKLPFLLLMIVISSLPVFSQENSLKDFAYAIKEYNFDWLRTYMENEISFTVSNWSENPIPEIFHEGNKEKNVALDFISVALEKSILNLENLEDLKTFENPDDDTYSFLIPFKPDPDYFLEFCFKKVDNELLLYEICLSCYA